jgi:hypothetical protein
MSKWKKAIERYIYLNAASQIEFRALKSSSNRVAGEWRVVASAGDAGKPVEEAAGGVGVVAAASAVEVMEWFCRTEVLR